MPLSSLYMRKARAGLHPAARWCVFLHPSCGQAQVQVQADWRYSCRVLARTLLYEHELSDSGIIEKIATKKNVFTETRSCVSRRMGHKLTDVVWQVECVRACALKNIIALHYVGRGCVYRGLSHVYWYWALGAFIMLPSGAGQMIYYASGLTEIHDFM